LFVSINYKNGNANNKEPKLKGQGRPSITIEDYDNPRPDAKKLWRRLLNVVIATNSIEKTVYSNKH